MVNEYNYGVVFVQKHVLWLFSGADIDAKFEIHNFDNLIAKKEEWINEDKKIIPKWHLIVSKGDYTYEVIVNKLELNFIDVITKKPTLPE